MRLQRCGGLGIMIGAVLIGRGEPAAWGQLAKVQAPGKPEPKEIALEVTPQRPPTPLFRYRLFPTLGELNPGNAAPLYLRLGYEMNEEKLRDSFGQALEWLGLPLASFPREDAAKMAAEWAPQLRQIEFGARRRYCDWDYSIPEEKDNPFFIRLPDAQVMREWVRLLAVRARAEIAAGQLDRAVGTLETMIAFGRHIGQGPYLINKLVGVAAITVTLGLVDDLIGQPDAPNLYWALTALPRTLVDMREAIENEQASIGRTLTGQLLEEFDLGRHRSDAEWSALLADLHRRMVRLQDGFTPPPAHATPTDLDAYKAAMLPQARDYLQAHHLSATSDDQALAVAIIGLYRERTDDYSQLAYLPYPDADRLIGAVEQRNVAAKAGIGLPVVQVLPALQAALAAEARLARKVAALRVVEALRLHAADHGGHLPESLDQVRAAPIPTDPFAGRPFDYRREGDAALLTGADPMSSARLIYRISIRK